jgi:hypothetical protein
MRKDGYPKFANEAAQYTAASPWEALGIGKPARDKIPIEVVLRRSLGGL